MTQEGTVLSILPDGKAKVSVLRQNACGKACTSCGSCVSLQKPLEIEAENPVNARPGDRVLIETGTKRVLGIAVLVYLTPLLFLFFGYALLAEKSETMGIVGAAVGFTASAPLLLPVNRWLQAESFRCQIISILRD